MGDAAAGLGRGDDAQRLQLAVQRRAFHADEGRGARDIAAEAVDLGEQVFALEEFARLAQRQRGQRAAEHDPPLLGRAALARQLARLDRAGALAKDQHPLDDVAQLADVARPVHRLQRRPRLFRDLARGQALGAVEGLDEMPGEQRDVLAPLAQRRHRDRHHVEPVEQLLAEAAGGDLGGQIARRRGDHPQIDPHLVGAAHPGELLLGQHPQDLRLRARGHLGDLVEIDHPAMRLLKQPLLDAAFRGLAAEEHLFHPVGCDRGRVHRDEGRRGAVRVLMHEARRGLLARSRLAGQHHPAVRLRHLVELVLELAEGGRGAEHLARMQVAPAQRGVFAPQPGGLHRAADHHHQLVDIERLLDEVIGALLDRGDGDLDVAVARDDDDRDVGVVALHRLQDVDAVHPAVLQPDVEDHQRRRLGVDLLHALVGIRRQTSGIALVLQDVGDQFADVLLVVDDQNVTHGSHCP
ncbi:hypothetical protein SDC9_25082 [bioreactor metagenome]|uniref:Uncharacterized protein n=1 Tax=bioreactor metagenome TaxID=1076179 RepID=A0A644UJL3_9ZZZZ